MDSDKKTTEPDTDADADAGVTIDRLFFSSKSRANKKNRITSPCDFTLKIQ